jgi:hypothetical protein
MDESKRLQEIERSLASDPTNLDLAWEYWNALGSCNGCDIRSGMYVFEAFRPAAMQSIAGVLAFAQAYLELFDLSGEGPRQIDEALACKARSALLMLHGSEREVVQWMLDSVAKK